jgi:hypothetical protein
MPDTAPMARGSTCCDAMLAASIDSIIVDQTSDSLVADTRPRKSEATSRRRSDQFRTELTATAARESAIHNSATSIAPPG